MQFTQIIYYIFIIIGTINLLHLGAYLIGGDIYDIREFKRAKNRLKIKIIDPLEPLVSVIVPAYNEELSIVRCLDSLASGSYKYIEVLVHNDNSSDNTSTILKEYKKAHHDLKLQVINRRKNVGKGAGVNYAAGRYAVGDLIMTLDADCVLHKDAVSKTVKYFDDEKIIGVAANVKIIDSQTILGLLQKFEHLIGYRSKKFYTMTNSEFIVGGVASTYRRSIMEEVKYYDTDTVAEDIGLSMKVIARGNLDSTYAKSLKPQAH